MRNRCGGRTSSVKAMERETPNGHEKNSITSSNELFNALSRVFECRFA